MQKIPKIYFITSVIVLLLPLLMAISPANLDIYEYIYIGLVIVDPLLFLFGLLLAFYVFRNEITFKRYIRWGMWLNVLSAIVLSGFLGSL